MLYIPVLLLLLNKLSFIHSFMRPRLAACRVLKSKEASGVTCDFLKQTVNMFINYIKTLLKLLYGQRVS